MKNIQSISVLFLSEKTVFIILCVDTLSRITSARRVCLFFTRDAQYLVLISFNQTSFIKITSSLALDGYFLPLDYLCNFTSFLMRFKSGLFSGQSRTFSLFFQRYSETTSDPWHGGPFCMNIEVLHTPCVYSTFLAAVQHISGH